MPQGSGAGPWGYTKYTGPLGAVIRLLLILFHMFADDTQLYKSLNPRSLVSQHSVKNDMESCISAVSKWMTQNKLKLNDEKTEFMIIGTKQQTSKIVYNDIRVGNEQITSRSSVRNLGVFIDSELKMSIHVQNITKKCYITLREIKSIRKYLTTNATRTLVQALITSQLDLLKQPTVRH